MSENPMYELQQLIDAQPGICELCQADCERERQLCDECDETLSLERDRPCRNCNLGVKVEIRKGQKVHRYRQQIDKMHDVWEERFEPCTAKEKHGRPNARNHHSR